MRFIFFMVSACLTICCHAQVKERVSSAQQRSIAAPVSTEDSITTAINAMFEQMRQDIETNFAKLILEKKKEKAELESRPNTANQQLVKLNQEIAKLDGSVNNIQQLMNVLATASTPCIVLPILQAVLFPQKTKYSTA